LHRLCVLVLSALSKDTNTNTNNQTK